MAMPDNAPHNALARAMAAPKPAIDWGVIAPPRPLIQPAPVYVLEESDDGGPWHWQGSGATGAAEARDKVRDRRRELSAKGAAGVRVRARPLRNGEN